MIFCHPKSHVRVVVHSHDFAYAATDSQLRKIRSVMCEWYDVKVLGILGCGKRVACGIKLTWTEEGLVNEAN